MTILLTLLMKQPSPNQSQVVYTQATTQVCIINNYYVFFCYFSGGLGKIIYAG